MVDENINGTSNSDIGYGELLAVLLRRKLWIAMAILVTLPIAGLLSLRKDPSYRSSLQLLVEPNYRQRADIARERAESRFAESTLEIDYATQLRLMRSSELLQRAVDRLETDYPDVTSAEIGRFLAVNRVTETEDQIETKILQIDYTSSDPEKSQRILQAMQEVYLRYNLEQQQVRLKEGLAFIDQQIPEARQDLYQSERALEQFRESQNLVNPEDQATATLQSLRDIEQQRQLIQADYQDAQARYGSIQSQLNRSPDNALLSSRLSESTRYQDLLNALQQTDLELAALRTTYTDSAPNVQLLLKQQKNQIGLLEQEARRVLGGTAQSNSGGSRNSSVNIVQDAQLGNTDLSLAAELIAVQTLIQGLDARDQSLFALERELRTAVKQFPNLIAEYNRLQPEVDIKRDTLQQLLRARQDLSIDIARGGFNWQVVEEPQIGYKTGPNLQIDLLLGGIVGLFLGCIMAFIKDASDSTVHDVNSLRQRVTLPILGIIPQFQKGALQNKRLASVPSQTPRFTVEAAFNWPPFREALDLVYKNFQGLTTNSHHCSVMVTSAIAGEGKTTVSIGLSASIARLNRRVLLIDADLRRPKVHNELKLSNQQGLTTLLSGRDDQPAIHPVAIVDTTIDVLTAGPRIDDPFALINSQSMQDMINLFRKDYDLVVIDTSPVIGTADAMQIASLSNNILMVSRLNKITQAELVQAALMLSAYENVGIVVNGERNVFEYYSSYIEDDKIVLGVS